MFGGIADGIAELIIHITVVVVLINMGGNFRIVAVVIIGIYALGGILRGVGVWLERNK